MPELLAPATRTRPFSDSRMVAASNGRKFSTEISRSSMTLVLQAETPGTRQSGCGSTTESGMDDRAEERWLSVSSGMGFFREDQESKTSPGHRPGRRRIRRGDKGVVTGTHGPSNALVSALRRPHRSNSQADGPIPRLSAERSRRRARCVPNRLVICGVSRAIRDVPSTVLNCGRAGQRNTAGDLLSSRSSCRAASGPRSLALLAGRVGLPQTLGHLAAHGRGVAALSGWLSLRRSCHTRATSHGEPRYEAVTHGCLLLVACVDARAGHPAARRPIFQAGHAVSITVARSYCSGAGLRHDQPVSRMYESAL